MKYTLVFLAFFMASTALFAQDATVNIEQDADIETLLEYRKDPKTHQIYKIQVFQSIDPDAASAARQKFLNQYGDWPVDIHWNTPNYKVWVGNFGSRLEADRALQKIKKKYMNAIVFKPKVTL